MNGFVTFSRSRSVLLLVFVSSLSAGLFAQQRYPASGLVLKIDPAHNSAIISCNAIPGYMQAMTMPMSVRAASDLDNLKPGTMIDVVLTADIVSLFAESVRSRAYQGI